MRLRIRNSPLTVNSDPVLLPRMVSNLVSNAIHHTRSSGVLLCCRKRRGVASIEIWDTGVGIPSDQTEAIFQEFYQLGGPEKDRRKGLGLGLNAVRLSSFALSLSKGEWASTSSARTANRTVLAWALQSCVASAIFWVTPLKCARW